ncbi:undecaprenyl/decaprenyl-phosphate alpha-N-acetylglucosaminyl 1-phosphate transferase [Candidatus Poribacteria bacterium]|nr:undecaprenyl/decaprenyl-phosphate alpha-N-acetylglucosaminyl 1-phosphate transferase [Candidatus Poribacteria bacterium]
MPVKCLISLARQESVRHCNSFTGRRTMEVDVFLTLLIILLGPFFLSVLITPFLRKIAIENGLVDGLNERKIHLEAIPRVGGIAIAISFFTAVVLAYSLFHADLAASISYLTGLCIGGALIFLIGLLDDIKGLNAPKKFAGQILSALALVPFGFLIKTLEIPFIGTVHLGFFFGIALTVFWVVAIINAFNLIDGMDGLSSGVAVIASITLAIFSILSGKLLMAIVLIAVLGSTLGFLWHNWHPAKIFMGDCGAMFLGFLLAAVSIKTSYQGTTVNTIFVPVLALGLPIIDTIAAISRRLWHRKPLFSADKKHIHHKLLDAGFTVRQAALILYYVCILLGVTALVTTMVRSSIAVGIVIGVALVASVGVIMLGRKAEKSSPKM